MCIVAVHVEQAISIVRGMSSVEVMEPEPALFQVETSLKSGRPPRWTLNGSVLEPNATVNIDRKGTLHSLCLTCTESSMSGPLVFVAGKSRSTAQLTVKGELSQPHQSGLWKTIWTCYREEFFLILKVYYVEKVDWWVIPRLSNTHYGCWPKLPTSIWRPRNETY